MHFVKTMGVCLLAGLLVAGCGDGISKLSPDQKVHFNETMRSLGRSLRAGIAAKQDASPVAGSSRSASQRDPLEEKMTAKLVSQCVVAASPVGPDFSRSGSPVAKSDMRFKLKLSDKSGGSCPVAIDFGMEVHGSRSGATANLDWEYSVKDKDYVSLNDVSGVSFHANSKSSIESSEQTVKLNATFSGGGSITSVKDGVLPVSLNGGASGEKTRTSGVVDSWATLTFKYPGFTVELKATEKDTVGAATVSNFYLNGEDITEDQFKQYFKQGGLDLETGLFTPGS